MSLLRTAARVSVATRVVGNVQRKQQRRWAAEDAHAAAMAPQQAVAAPPAPVAPPAPTASDPATMIAQLTQLGQLRDAGVLTPEEFEGQKQRILAG